MEKRKLGINTTAGIMDILGAILYLVSLFVVAGAAIAEVAGEAASGSTTGTAMFFYIFAGASLVIHIVALVKSRKAQISNVGNILGIIGHGLFLLTMLMAIPALILCILAAVFTLKQKNLNVQQLNA